MATSNDPRPWGLARYLGTTLGGFVAVVFVPFFLATMVVALLLDRFATLDGSLWESATLLVRIYALVMAAHVVNTHFSLFLAQGGTRREYFRQLAAFLIGHGVLLAVLITLGFWLESLVAELLGWSITVNTYTFVDEATDFGPILATFAVIMVTWSVATALGAAAVYRNREAGGLAVVAAGLVVLLAESSMGSGFRFLGFLTRILDYQPSSFGASVTIGGIVALLSLIVCWGVIRTMPVKNPAE